jgi:L-arabinonolactonase
MTVRVAASTRDVLGECPVHDVGDGSLRWVDIGRSLWHRLDLVSGEVTTLNVAPALTAFAPTDTGDYIGAFVSGLARLDRKGHRDAWLAQPEAGIVTNRFNDAGTDPKGRLIAGTMNMQDGGPTGALYSLTGEDLSLLRPGIGIANTIAFSPDGSRLYTADSAKGELAAFAYDVESGRVGPRIESFRPDPDLPGAPDGSAVDAEECVWNARWGGGCVVRLAPDGTTLAKIELPVRLPTSCCFVGTSLFVTTSTWDFSEADLQAQPMAGHLLAIDVDVTGLPRPRFVTAGK